LLLQQIAGVDGPLAVNTLSLKRFKMADGNHFERRKLPFLCIPIKNMVNKHSENTSKKY